ncbi:unnamed protein product [Prorocentrum cordatum]|uniref:Uncharacterized protein n=1 Tax=Prorocentrum cordatum TaxID=2364126 RepID=A0ABN9TXS1_9DINO|nr:unnamed protein product [Polarella glacialis]
MGPAGSDAAEARAPRPLAVDGGGAQHKTNSRGPRRGLGAQVPRRRGGEAGRGQTPSRGGGGPLVLTHDVGGLGNEAAFAATGPSSGGEERAPRPRRRGPRGSPPEPPAAAPCPGARGHLCGAAGPRHAAPATRPRRGGPRRGTAEAAVCGAVRGRAGSVGLVPAVRSCSCRQRLTARAPAAPPRGCWPASGRA